MDKLQIEKLKKEVNFAFRGVQLGRGVSWREADVIDDYGSKAQREAARAKDELKDWTKVPYDLIGNLYYQAVISFLDNWGLRFYTPILIQYTLDNIKTCKSVIIESFMYSLANERKIQQFKPILSKDQIDCIIGFLEWNVENGYTLTKDELLKTLAIWKN